MKNRSKKLKVKKARRVSSLGRLGRRARISREPTVMERISQVTDELQTLRSRLANAGDDLPAVGTHRIASLELELERLWEKRRQEQAAPLRESALTEEEEKILAFPNPGRARG